MCCGSRRAPLVASDALGIWEEPLAQQPAPFDTYQQLLDAAAAPTPDFHLYLPDRGRGHAQISHPAPDADGWQARWIGAAPADSVFRRENLSGFFYDLHFFWHAQTSYALQNLGGVLLLVARLAAAAGAAQRWVSPTRKKRPPLAALALGALRVGYAYGGALMLLAPLLILADG